MSQDAAAPAANTGAPKESEMTCFIEYDLDKAIKKSKEGFNVDDFILERRTKLAVYKENYPDIDWPSQNEEFAFKCGLALFEYEGAPEDWVSSSAALSSPTKATLSAEAKQTFTCNLIALYNPYLNYLAAQMGLRTF